MPYYILILRCLILAFLACKQAIARPNIVFLLADDQATISMGCYGNSDARTPNLDSLSARGVTFDNHYDTTAICMASRATILTGKYEYEHGCNFTKGKLKASDFAQSYPLLLRRAGYLTAFAGKFGVDLAEGLPVSSFDKWGGGKGQTSYVTLRNKWMKEYAEKYPHSTLSYGAFGCDFIKEATKKDKPFCLSISFKAPHMPDTPDAKFNSIYKGKTFKRPPNFGREYAKHLSSQSKQGRQWERWDSWGYSSRYDEVMRKYHQLVHGIDHATGMIMDALKESGALDNTVIIYTSDNGFLCGSHGYGSKVLPYEESVRVPMIIFDPRHKSSGQGTRVSALTGNIDIAPTILELAGLKAESGIEGKNLMPLLDEPEKEIHKQLYLMNCWGPEAAQSLSVVTRDWKYIYWYYGHEMNPTEELFDMRKDKLELFNTANDPQQKKALQLMRSHYDNAVSSIKNKGAPTHKVYGKLFDRKVPWNQKTALINSFKNK
ncbi:MAG: sulfatase [Akkermansiaceae bacterium]|nr:sulfatase [Akkermansiaceae bacterium]